MTHRPSIALAACAASALLAACAVSEPSPNVPSYAAPPPPPQPYATRGEVVEPRYARNTGVVSSIELIRGEANRGISPGGVIIGAVVGGLLGNQIGAGNGRAAATVAGAAAGGYAGNAIGQRTQSAPDIYRVAVQYDGGGSQYIDVPDPGPLRTGDRVRVDGNQISRY